MLGRITLWCVHWMAQWRASNTEEPMIAINSEVKCSVCPPDGGQDDRFDVTITKVAEGTWQDPFIPGEVKVSPDGDGPDAEFEALKEAISDRYMDHPCVGSVGRFELIPLRPSTLYDLELPGFEFLRERGWRVLKYDHGVVLARYFRRDGSFEYGVWAPSFNGSGLCSGEYRIVRNWDHNGIPESLLASFVDRAAKEADRFEGRGPE
jgi:hypothetical protein